MKVLGNIYSHNSPKNRKRQNAREISQSVPLAAKSYGELIETIAEIAYHNQDCLPLYRGQKEDYQTGKGKSQSALFGILNRLEGSSHAIGTQKAEQKKVLDAATKTFVPFIKKSRYKKDIIQTNFTYTDELVWAVFQHYGFLPTPLLDLTQSIHVAASFAALNNQTNKAYVYMLGFDSINANISYSWHERYQLIRLSSIMPKIARRPLYQEGYLLGDFPSKRSFQGNRTNFAVRLMAKFVFNPRQKDFFKPLKPLSKEFLLPMEDTMKELLEQFRKEPVFSR